MGRYEYLSAFLIGAGALIMLSCLRKGHALTYRLPARQMARWRFAVILLGFFILAYALSAVILVMKIQVPFVLATGIVFAAGACFVWLIVDVTSSSVHDITRSRDSLIDLNNELEREIGARIRAEEELREISQTDELTGLLNRRGFGAMAEQAMRLAIRRAENVSMVFADLDRLKEINDRGGHFEGDNALRDLSRILTETFRDSDIIGRIGGDEFAIFMTGSRQDSTALVVRLRENVARFNERLERPYRLSISIGNAYCGAKCDKSVEDMIIQADKSMYANKRRPASEKEA